MCDDYATRRHEIVRILAGAAAVMCRRLLGAPLQSYFDDFSGACAADEAGDELGDIMEFCALLGIEFKREKTQLGQKIKLLGIDIWQKHENGEARLMVGIDEERLGRMKKTIDDALRLGELGSDTAASLAGKLSFCSYVLFGRSGRAFLPPLYARQHASGCYKIGDRLRSALQFWSGVLETAEFWSRNVSEIHDDLPPIVMSTDAMYEPAGVKGVVNVGLGATMLVEDGDSCAGNFPCVARRAGFAALRFFPASRLVVVDPAIRHDPTESDEHTADAERRSFSLMSSRAEPSLPAFFPYHSLLCLHAVAARPRPPSSSSAARRVAPPASVRRLQTRRWLPSRRPSRRLATQQPMQCGS